MPRKEVGGRYLAFADRLIECSSSLVETSRGVHLDIFALNFAKGSDSSLGSLHV